MSNKRKQSQPTDLWLLYSWAEVLRSHRWPRRPHCGDSYVCREPVWCSRLWNAPRRCTSRCPRGWVPCPHRNTPSHEPLPNHWRRHRDTGSSLCLFCKYMCDYKRTKEKPNVIIYTIEGYKNIFLKYLEFSLTLLLWLLTVYDTVSISVTVYLKPRLGWPDNTDNYVRLIRFSYDPADRVGEGAFIMWLL